MTYAIDATELCDFNGEQSGAALAGGWIDELAAKGTANTVDEGLEESLEGYGWLVGRMPRRRRSEAAELDFG